MADPRSTDPRLPDPTAGPGPRRVLVTGADSGIGKACAVALADDAEHVALTWHADEEGARRTAEEVTARGARPHLLHLDLTDPTSAPGVVDEAVGAMGGLDAVVLSAGTGTATPFLEVTWQEWRDVLAVDLDGAFLCLQRSAHHLVQQGSGGRIVAITSVHEHAPRVGAAPYCAAKGGLGLLVKVAALELAEHGITVNAVAPGEIATPMTGQEDESPLEAARPGVPLGRPGDAREVASVVRLLCRPDGGYVTGASWAVDGGMLTMGPMAGSHLVTDAWRRA
ncbi:SDR family oxidoreductase [Cellulomonas sp. PhB150]|uniref:SDR family oxidoreductase n=1 Tax=Cellulomonas sp. PhB150 TaxID=2485188 RepID=UPI000F4A7F94|nr:SDR family oxidoreductase [Cellulomonas sp. PhB150]ROS26071.1 NAD(P)-dependent dehydrogenase (short-subunit alcohol dehydrogenase family) [Cellulomonas sp. PhB150]